MGLGEAVGAGDQHQGPLPEVLLLMVLGQAGPQIARLADVDASVVVACLFPHQHIDPHLAALLHGQEVGQQAAGHFDHLHDTGGDLGDADAGVRHWAGRSGSSWVSGSCGAATGHQTPHTDLAGDGGGNQGGAGNRYRADAALLGLRQR